MHGSGDWKLPRIEDKGIPCSIHSKSPGMICMTDTYLRTTDFRDPDGTGEYLALKVKPTKHNVDIMIQNLQEWIRQLEEFKLGMS